MNRGCEEIRDDSYVTRIAAVVTAIAAAASAVPRKPCVSDWLRTDGAVTKSIWGGLHSEIPLEADTGEHHPSREVNAYSIRVAHLSYLGELCCPQFRLFSIAYPSLTVSFTAVCPCKCSFLRCGNMCSNRFLSKSLFKCRCFVFDRKIRLVVVCYCFHSLFYVHTSPISVQIARVGIKPAKPAVT